MSFAVIHMQKFKTGGIRGINNHNAYFINIIMNQSVLTS